MTACMTGNTSFYAAKNGASCSAFSPIITVFTGIALAVSVLICLPLSLLVLVLLGVVLLPLRRQSQEA